MRYAQIGLATLGVIASAVATAFAIADGVRGPYPTAPGFYAAGAALITLGGLGLTLAWRQRRGAAMTLVLAAIGGFVAWPYAVAAMAYLAAAMVSLGASALRPGSDQLLRGALGVALLLLLAMVALVVLRSFSYPLVGAFAALAAFVAASVEFIRPRHVRRTSAAP